LPGRPEAIRPVGRAGPEGKEVMGRRSTWTSKDDDLLRALAASGENSAAIAARLKRTAAGIRKRATSLNKGGERAAVIYTLIESAKLNGLDPEAYLADVIDRMVKGHSINRLDELLPWNWQRSRIKLAA
jgi:hypothetical protein